MMSHNRILSVLNPKSLEEHLTFLHARHTTYLTKPGNINLKITLTDIP